ncbi:tetratricopeptide repeat-containing sensor histidine kinase [Tenacibaculum amylolyticum]|uniref:tetratricopeptide repeat-containing sensor histidine kinase n=1 Tax=Tenacibaculum amylolyticum TaxID=104269 RepID=UPI0038B4EC9E
MKSKYLSLYFIFLFNTFFSIGQTNPVRDKILEEVKKAKSSKNYNKAIKLSKKLLNFAEKSDYETLGNDYKRLGFYYKKNKKKDSAYFYYEKSLENYLVSNDSTNISKNLLYLAKIESDFELYYKSDSTALSALSYLKSGDSKIKASIYNCLGINHKKRYDYEEAIGYYKKALKLTEKEEEKYRYKGNLANCYKELRSYNKSLIILEDIIKGSYFKSLNKISRARILDNYYFIKFLNKELVVEKDFLDQLRIKKEENDYQSIVVSYSHLVDFFKFKDEQKAKAYAFEMLKTARKTHNKKAIAEALIKLLHFNVPNKGKYIKEYITINKKLEKEKKISQNKTTAAIYRVKEIELKVEKEKNERIKSDLKFEEEKGKKQQLFFLIVISSITFIIYIFYRRQKTKKEKIVEVYKTETRLAKRIHDELANDVYLTMNKLQNGESYSQSALLSDLENIYIQTRDISHENSPVVTGAKFQEFLQQLFIDFSTDNCKVISKGVTEVGIENIAEEKQIVLYRVLQELLINMDKHSKATIVVISFTVEKNRIKVQYKDNGQGTTTIKLKSGLQNMETRIKSIGGSITFDSEKQQGFLVKFQFKK